MVLQVGKLWNWIHKACDFVGCTVSCQIFDVSLDTSQFRKSLAMKRQFLPEKLAFLTPPNYQSKYRQEAIHDAWCVVCGESLKSGEPNFRSITISPARGWFDLWCSLKLKQLKRFPRTEPATFFCLDEMDRVFSFLTYERTLFLSRILGVCSAAQVTSCF
jgi:hypothetical protein